MTEAAYKRQPDTYTSPYPPEVLALVARSARQAWGLKVFMGAYAGLGQALAQGPGDDLDAQAWREVHGHLAAMVRAFNEEMQRQIDALLQDARTLQETVVQDLRRP